MLTDKILLIDDDPDELLILLEVLAEVDDTIDCVAALDCSQGFQRLDQSQGLPRYIFLDLNMPASHGKYCLVKIKKHPRYNAVPVIIYTTSRRQADVDEAKRLGAELFFTKPNDMSQLKEIVSYIVSEKWKDN